MRKEFFLEFFWGKSLLFVLAALILTFSPILSQPSSAQCIREGNTIILTLSATSAILYWDESCSDNSSKVYYQRSVDGLKSWSAAKLLINFTDGRTALQEFSGIINSGTTLLASFAVKRPTGGAKIYIKTSNDKGATWSTTRLVKSFSGSFGGCPVLDSSYESKLGLFVLRTVIQDGDSAHVYLLTSSDGIDWFSSQLGGSNFPPTCDD